MKGKMPKSEMPDDDRREIARKLLEAASAGSASDRRAKIDRLLEAAGHNSTTGRHEMIGLILGAAGISGSDTDRLVVIYGMLMMACLPGSATDLRSFCSGSDVAKYIKKYREAQKIGPVVTMSSPDAWSDLINESPGLCRRLEFHDFPADSAMKMKIGFVIPGGPNPSGARTRMLEAQENDRIVDALAAAYEAGYGDGYIKRSMEPKTYGGKRERKPTRNEVTMTMMDRNHDSRLAVEKALMLVGVSQGEARRLARVAGKIRGGFPRKKRAVRSVGK